MDWFTVLLIFIFFVLPLLQELMRRRGPPPPELPPEEDEWEWELPQERQREGSGRRPTTEEWSEEWEEWPGEVRETAEERREVSAWEELGLEDIFGRPAEAPPEPPREAAPPPPPPTARVPEPVMAPQAPPSPPPSPPQVVSLEALEVDRTAEHARFHERYVVRPVPNVRHQQQAPLAALMQDGSELRRAIILSEVLGPPRALRPPEISAGA